jgi:L-malate glycosyltransferase
MGEGSTPDHSFVRNDRRFTRRTPTPLARVLHLLDSFNQGGTERQAVQLLRLLSQTGRYELHVACLDPNGVLRPEVEALGFEDIPAYPLTSFFDADALRQVRRFANLLRSLGIDILHTHDFYTNIFGMAGAALARVPVRVASRRESAMRSAARRFLERGAFRLADSVVANCEEVRRQLVAEGVKPAKLATIHNGLDVAKFHLASPEPRSARLSRLGLPDSPLVTIVANMRLRVKDHPTFLRAARLVHEAVPEAAFVLAGEGELEGPLRRLAEELGLAACTYFTGRSPDVPSLLAVSDVCVLSSTHEGFSNSIVEYMAAGRPVVATEVGGAREAVVEGETGFLVPPGDARLMAARVTALLTDPARAAEMGLAGRRLVESRFSCEAQLDHVERLYEKLMVSRDPRRAPNGRRAPVPQTSVPYLTTSKTRTEL